MPIRIEGSLKGLVYVLGSQERLELEALWIPKKMTLTRLKATKDGPKDGVGGMGWW